MYSIVGLQDEFGNLHYETEQELRTFIEKMDETTLFNYKTGEQGMTSK